MTPEVISAIADSATAIAAACGIGIAFAGLRTWRDQLTGQNEYEVARRLLRVALATRDRIAFVRHPVITGGEVAAAYKEAGLETPQDGLLNDQRADELVYDRRWKELSKALSDLGAELLEAEVLWGPDVHKPASELQRCVGELNGAIRHHLMSKARSSPYRADQVSAELREKYFRVLYEGGSDGEDEFSTRVQLAVNAFEKFLRPKLQLKSAGRAA